MSMEKILREINYDIAIKEVSEKAMEIGRTKPYYSNFVEKKEVKHMANKELTRVINAQITLIMKDQEDADLNVILNDDTKSDCKEVIKNMCNDFLGADDVQVEIHDFVWIRSDSYDTRRRICG